MDDKRANADTASVVESHTPENGNARRTKPRGCAFRSYQKGLNLKNVQELEKLLLFATDIHYQKWVIK